MTTETLKRSQKRFCVSCGGRIPREKVRGVKYCSRECQEVASKAKIRELNPPLGISTGAVGALSELVAAVDLMKRGYAVFRALSPDCSCDLAIVKDKELWRVEVKTGYRYPNGKIYYPVSSKKQSLELYDVLAVVINAASEVLYKGLPGVEPHCELNASPPSAKAHT